eukprot:NODE_119_length_2443_cov_646.746867_g85_i0.p1 GENE.NODE_119_length_2443_cov_646.746867_g85_i0~~NODE_119_length_2443_cov_646.746867_g85_i0.p1  ORF type:complete len:255 (-),score=69.22 NODE_119_length_2443_cov_646.746867_g85_i0:1065-1829(-)
MGTRMLRQWIAQPLLDISEIHKRQSFVSIFMEDVLFCNTIKLDILKKIPDLDGLIKKLQRRRAKLDDTVTIQRFLQCLPVLVDVLNQYNGDHVELLRSEFVEQLEEIVGYASTLITLIGSTLEQGAEVLIQPSFDDELENLAGQRKEVEYALNKEYKNMLADLDVKEKDCKLEKTAGHGFYYKISRARSDDSFPGYEVILTNKGGTQFTSANLKRLSGQYMDLLKTYMVRQSDLEKKYLETVFTLLGHPLIIHP